MRATTEPIERALMLAEEAKSQPKPKTDNSWSEAIEKMKPMLATELEKVETQLQAVEAEQKCASTAVHATTSIDIGSIYERACTPAALWLMYMHMLPVLTRERCRNYINLG